MLTCNIHSKHRNVTQKLYLVPVQPRFGAPRSPRWRCVIKVYLCAFTPNYRRNHVVINNVHEKTSQKGKTGEILKGCARYL